jgi:hypothetical protein
VLLSLNHWLAVLSLDPRWVSRLILAGILIGLLLLARFLANSGGMGKYSRGLGRGFFELDAMLQPSRKHVREAKQQQRKVEDDQGGPDQSGRKQNVKDLEP